MTGFLLFPEGILPYCPCRHYGAAGNQKCDMPTGVLHYVAAGMAQEN